MPQRETEQSSWFVDAVLPHEPGLRRWIHSRFSAIRDVDDLIQETFSRILKIHESGPIPNPQAFLFVVSRNLAIKKKLRKDIPTHHEPVGLLEAVFESRKK